MMARQIPATEVSMRRLLMWLILQIAACGLVQGQDIHAISGGTKTIPDLKDKGQIQLVAENGSLKLTLGRSQMWKHSRARMIGFYLKVENLSDQPFRVEPGKFAATTADGRALSGLETEEVVKRYNDTEGIRTAALPYPNMQPAIQARIGEAIRRESLPAGEIPPHTFKEGFIVFEAPNDSRYTLKLQLTGLWPDLFIFSTEKEKK
jgi:hypothetical protein